MTVEGSVRTSLREGKALLVAGVISVIGDSLAAVGAAFLVNARTDSAGLTALTLAAAFLPGLLSGFGLASLADRFPRRDLLIVCELLCAPIILCTVISGMPALGIIGLVALAELVAGPFRSARAALFAEVVPKRNLPRMLALDRTADQMCLFLGVVLGAATVGALGAERALAVDAGTFTLSALVIAGAVSHRPRPQSSAELPLLGGAKDGWQAICAHPLALRSVLVTWATIGGGIVLEGLAIPLARHYSGGTAESTETTNVVLVLLGTLTGVGVIGAFVGSWMSPSTQRRLMVPLGLVSALPGLALVTRPPEGVAVAIYAAGGMAAVASIFGQILFTRAMPDETFGRAMGVASGGVSFFQGVALAVAATMTAFFDVEDVLAGVSVAITGLVLLAGAVTRRPAAMEPAAPEEPPSRLDEPGPPPPEEQERVEIDLTLPKAPVQAGIEWAAEVSRFQRAEDRPA